MAPEILTEQPFTNFMLIYTLYWNTRKWVMMFGQKKKKVILGLSLDHSLIVNFNIKTAEAVVVVVVVGICWELTNDRHCLKHLHGWVHLILKTTMGQA